MRVLVPFPDGTMRLFLAFSVLALLAATAPAAQAQSSDDKLGYVSPQVVESWFDQPPTVEVNLRGALLQMAAHTADDATEEETPDVGPLLDRLEAIRVRIFKPGDDVSMKSLEARSTALTERLKREGWKTVVRVREPEEQVSIQTRSRSEDALAGMVVLVNEKGGESVFVNIVGDISPEELGRLTGSIDGLDGLGDVGSDSSNETGGEDDQ